MKLQIEISVITVNYNGYIDTCEFIDSWIKAITSVSYEIIVIDNGSKNNEGHLLKQKYPFSKIIRSETNLGFAGANNLGIKIAKGEYLFFLNNDTILIHDDIRLLINRLRSSNSIAGVSPLIRDYQEPFAIQFAGYTPLSPITLRNRAIGEGKFEKYKASETPYLHGAAMLMKADIIQKIGPMPEEYFLYYEELDWCTRITSQGYQLWFDPSCEIKHKSSKTIGQSSPLKSYFLSKNRLLYASRNRAGLLRYIAILYQLLIVLPKDIFKVLIHGHTEIAKAHLKGVIAFVKS